MTSVADVLPLESTVIAKTAGDVADCVRACAESETPVYPIAGGTALAYGVYPLRPGIALDLSDLSGIVEHTAEDMTLTVEAGTTMAKIREQLAKHDQWLPIDVPHADRATIGGVVATAASGSRRLGHGTIRDYVIGLHAVDGRGDSFTGGGRVVKNAAGYDLCRLLTGSMGTLAVLTQVTLMVRPQPQRRRLLVGTVSNVAEGIRLVESLQHVEPSLAAVDVISGDVWDDVPGLPALSHDALGRLVILIEGHASEVDWVVGEIADQWEREFRQSVTVLSDTDRDHFWEQMVDFSGSPEAGKDEWTLTMELGLPATHVLGRHARLMRIDPACAIQTHVRDGVTRVCFRMGAGGIPAQVRAELEREHPGATWSVVTWHPASLALSREAVWGTTVGGRKLMQAVKERFDPRGILNPDRYIL